jgi:hypothetical protein
VISGLSIVTNFSSFTMSSVANASLRASVILRRSYAK